jgi:RND family efflux transporter MFP subunit
MMLVIIVAGSSIDCSRSAGPGGRGGPRGDAVAIKVAKVQRIAIQRQVELSGTLLSINQARVSSEAAGVVREVPIQLGTEVRPGDVLVRLDARENSYALARAESALRQTEAQLGIAEGQAALPADEEIASVRTAAATRDDARSNFERVQRLVTRGLLSQMEFEAAQTKLKVAEANYQSTFDSARSLKASLQDRRAAWESAKKRAEDTTVRAPVGGLVSERLVQPGEFINANTPVATIVQVDPLKLRTALQERYAGLIAPKLPVEFRVESFPGQTFRGEMAYVSPAVDQATRTFPVEALVDNADRRLKPGFFAKGVVTTKRDDNVFAISDETVSTLAGVSAVYVVEQGKIRQQVVTLGVRQGNLFEVVDGLKGDEVLAASNLNQLATGTPVQVGEGGGGRGPGAGRGTPADGGRRGNGAGGQRGGQR